jgi:hypothetical protein
MKINWRAHSLRAIYVFVGTGVLAIVWTWLEWPWAGVVIWLPLLAAYVYLVSQSAKRERLRKSNCGKRVGIYATT